MKVILTLLALVASNQALAEIYRIVDSSGRIQYTDQNPSEEKSPFKGSSSLPSKPSPSSTSSKKAQGEMPRSGDVTIYVSRTCVNCSSATAYFKANSIKFSEIHTENSPQNESKFIALGGRINEYLITCGKNKLIAWAWRQKDFEELCLHSNPSAQETRRFPFGAP